MQRNFGQKIALVSAVVCAGMVLPALAGIAWVWQQRGPADPWVPSIAAIIFFLISCAVVLAVMSRPKPPLPGPDGRGAPPPPR